MPPFSLDICFLPSQGLGSLLRKTVWLTVPRSVGQGRKKKHLLGFKHLTLPLVEESLAQELEPSESLADPRGPRCVDLKLRQVNSSLTSLYQLLSNFSVSPEFSHRGAQGWGCGGCMSERGSHFSHYTLLFPLEWGISHTGWPISICCADF